MKLKLQPREVYGRMLWYPCCETSRKLLTLKKNGAKAPIAFSANDIRVFWDVGIEIEILPPEANIGCVEVPDFLKGKGGSPTSSLSS
jgi:hypothetical protein